MRVLTVGDPFQCIYGFRGAFLRAIETLADYLIQQVLSYYFCLFVC